MAQATAAAGTVMVRLQQRRHDVRRHRLHRGALVAPGLPAGRPRPWPSRCSTRAVDGRGRGDRAHRRHPGRRDEVRRRRPGRLGRRRPGAAPGQLRPGYEDAPGAEKATDLGPHDLVWLAEQTGLPVVVKGVLRADDARRCVQAGAARGLGVQPRRPPARPGRRARRRACPGSSRRSTARAQVYVDGGIRSGLDVLAALALGADAVFLGRLPLYALAVDGAGPGVGPPAGRARGELEECLAAGRRDGRPTRRRGSALESALRAADLRRCPRGQSEVTRPDLQVVGGVTYCSLLSPGSGGEQDRLRLRAPGPGGHPALSTSPSPGGVVARLIFENSTVCLSMNWFV